MNEVKKRGWVKNAAIIFLAVMLVLTFFSQTIMNRSLPEVAAQYTQSGSITARIRGSGTVSANETVEIMINQTRRIDAVPVKVGEEVTIGQVLIQLSGSVSDELDAAQKRLHDLELELERKLINTQWDGDLAGPNRAVSQARTTLANAQRDLAAIPYSDAALSNAQSALSNAQGVLANAFGPLSAANLVLEARMADLMAAQRELNALTPPPPFGTGDPDIYEQAELKVEEAADAVRQAQASVDAAQANVDAAKVVVDARENDVMTLMGLRSDWMMANANVRSAQEQVDQAVFNLSEAQKSAGVVTSNTTIDIREINRQIDEARDTLDALQKEGGRSEITAPVNGKITAITAGVVPGRDTNPSEPLMFIEVVDRGYTLTIQATAQQANRVSVGDTAEVDRGWWGGNMEPIFAVLTSIRPDPQNPATNRILHFNLSGGVESGNQLNLVMSQRSENYNIIVPNNAIREDTNGHFVLIVESRSSPLGNRFIATRADVNILASDDTNTAISGALSNWGDFVITTSSTPINPGDQVRLASN